MSRTRSWWGWGTVEDAVGGRERAALLARVSAALPGAELVAHEPPDVAALDLPDVPDLVVRPVDEREVVDLLDWCSRDAVAVVPYGGGSSVVGGVEPRLDGDYTGVVSLDLGRLDRVHEVDRTSRAARIQAGVLGPQLEDQLRPHGLTLRFFPQSFEFSSLGGWLATRAGGHFATLYPHVDDLVESLRVVTPAGVAESRRLPGSGAGPSPDRLFLGSEGALGVITEAWMRLRDRPRWRSTASAHFTDFAAAVAATRAVAQSGLHPANCRLLDPAEAFLNAGVATRGGVLVLGFESADHPVDAAMGRAVEICREHGGTLPEPPRAAGDDAAGTAAAGGAATGRDGATAAWRSAFLRMPYQRDALAQHGMIVETFETACTWDRFPALHAAVTEAATAALREVCGAGVLTCRFTHVYPDGPAPYFGIYAPGRWGSQVRQWDELKAAVSDALTAAGGTVTHHHAVGRDHRPWYDAQRPDLFAAALAAAKQRLDPAGVLNPGVLLPPQPARLP